MAIILKDTLRFLASVFPERKNKTGVRVCDNQLDSNLSQLDFLVKFAVCAAVGIVIISAVMNLDRIETSREALSRSAWGSWFLLMGEIFVGVNLLAFIWRLFLVLGYRPAPPCNDRRLPICTVVVPAYNEGKLVLSTLRSLAASDYPAHKLKIIAVDDGSVDDTWHWIQVAERELSGRISTIRLPENRGKRHALYAGFQKSKGDVLVTVDSDSVVEPQTLRHLVSPFLQDCRVGAVAGNVRVLNLKEGIIPRMLDVSFMFGFDFMRASQSEVETVMCTPGALSAYRRPVVMKVLDEWLVQTFFGKPANIGEDRAMTNLILRDGYFVRFQRNAVVYTNVPVRYKNLCKMFLRWARSNVRESIVMARFAFRRFRESSMLGARINLVLLLLSMTVCQALLVSTLVCLAMQPTVFGINILFGIVISSSFPAALYALKCRNSECLVAYVYGIYWFLSLSWISPYALFTMHRSGWLTRQIKSPNAQPESVPLPTFTEMPGRAFEKMAVSRIAENNSRGGVQPYMVQRTFENPALAGRVRFFL